MKKSVIKHLGIMIDHTPRWINHINYLSKKITRSLGLLSKIRYFVDFNTLINLYYTFIYSFLTYGLIVWGNTYQSILNPLLILQKRALRIITFSSFQEHSTPLFKYTKILKLCDLIHLHIAIFMYKFHANLLPSMRPHMFIYFSCYFDIDQGHSSSKQIGKETKPRRRVIELDNAVKGASSDLKKGLKNNIFWSERGSGFWEPCGTPPIWRSKKSYWKLHTKWLAQHLFTPKASSRMAQSFPLWQTVGSDAQWRWIHHVLFISVIARRLYVNKDRNSGLSILHHLSQTLFKKHSFHSENKKYLPHFSYASDNKQTRGNMGHALHYGYEMVPWCDVSAASTK